MDATMTMHLNSHIQTIASMSSLGFSPPAIALAPTLSRSSRCSASRGEIASWNNAGLIISNAIEESEISFESRTGRNEETNKSDRP